MKYAVEMGPGAMVNILTFISIGSGLEKLIGKDTQTERRSHKSTLENRLEIRISC
jgi:hypothetical protein